MVGKCGASSNEHYRSAQTARSRVDLCNICQQRKPLTWDHVPPKGSYAQGRAKVSMRPSVDLFGGTRPRESQNGLKFRTLCAECNGLLGSKFDPEIVAFTRSVRTYLSVKSLLLPARVHHHPFKVQRLMKGIVGHLLAAKRDLDDAHFDSIGRGYVLGEDEPLPDELNIFYWTYPYDVVQIRRDFAMFWPRGTFREVGGFHTLKYFPIAFLVSDKPQYAGLNCLSRYRDARVDDLVEIPIELYWEHEKDWPDAPCDEENNIVVVGNSGLMGLEARGR